MFRQLIWLLVLVAVSLHGGDVSAAESWAVKVRVFAESDIAPQGIDVRSLGGEAYSAKLQRDGDQRWTGVLQVDPMRLLPLELWVQQSGVSVRAHAGLVALAHGDQELDYLLRGPVPHAQRISSAHSASQVGTREAIRLGLGLVWVLLVAGGLVWSVRRHSDSGVFQWALGPLQSLLLWIGLATAWTWPAALAGGDRMVGRFLDAPGTVWSIDAAPRLLMGFRDWMTAWPVGADHHRFDSFTLVPLGWLFGAADPVQIHGWMMIAGVAASAWAAQGFAGAVGAKSPWTLLAGLGFGFSGLAANVLLEGHVYHVLNPWLPLLGWTLWRATSEAGQLRDGVLAGLFFCLCLGTTGYLGLVAALMAVGIVLGSREQIRVHPRPALTSALITLVGGGLYVWMYLAGGSGTGGELAELSPTSAHLAGLTAPTSELDRTEYGLAPMISAWMLGLVLLAPMVLPRAGRWRCLLWTAVLALFLSVAPTFSLAAGQVLVPISFDWLRDSNVGALIRFPVRLQWGWLLLGGVLSARVATEIAPRWGRLGGLVLLVAIVEAMILVGLPHRQVVRYAGAEPEAIAGAGGPVLNLFPDSVVQSDRMDLWLGSLVCMDQARHRQPVAQDCVATASGNVANRLRGWVTARLFEGDVARVSSTLQDLGFAAVALHEGVYAPGDRSRLVWALREMDPDPKTSGQSGDAIRLFEVPADARPASASAVLAGMTDAPAKSIVGSGQSLLVQLNTVRFGVVTDRSGSSHVLSVRVEDAKGARSELPITDDGVVAGDHPQDSVAWGRLTTTSPGRMRVQLIARGPQGEQVLWRGAVLPTVKDDSFVWRVTHGVAHPIAAMPGSPAPGIQPWNGWVVLVGWILVGGVLVRLRRTAVEQAA